LRNPSDRHLRQWYALADLYERAGDLPRARELFERVARVDHEAYDVLERLDALGPGVGRGRAPVGGRARGARQAGRRRRPPSPPGGAPRDAPARDARLPGRRRTEENPGGGPAGGK
ncbi:MAG TPA: tetratricopeptide repeat protein, partial [Acidimicrobiales bacterium]|nr:tetratricopeptide repeat protein [Acidimicrobiales bacterium]